MARSSHLGNTRCLIVKAVFHYLNLEILFLFLFSYFYPFHLLFLIVFLIVPNLLSRNKLLN